MRKQLNVSIGVFSRVPEAFVRVVDETTSCSSSTSKTLQDRTLKINQQWCIIRYLNKIMFLPS